MEWMKKDELEKTWENFRRHFTEDFFELNKDNELKKKHVGFVLDDTIYQPHEKEAHMADALKNLENSLTSDAANLTKLTTTNAKLAEQLKAELAQNKVLTDLHIKTICSVTSTQPENQNVNK